MSTADELEKVFNKLPEALVPEKVAGFNSVVQLNLGGEGGGDWVIKISNGAMDITEGQAAAPDVTLGMSAKDYVAITKGEANAMALFMGGRVKVQGNISVAMKFQELFDRNRVS